MGFSIKCFLLLRLILLSVDLCLVDSTVLVTGATGRTGSLLYLELKYERKIPVRALVRNRTKAKEVLHCERCDEAEGIYVGDVTNVTTLISALKGVDTVAIVAAASAYSSKKQQKAIEFDGVQHTIQALTQDANLQDIGISNLRAILCSSMGTSSPGSDQFGDILFWKLNAEAFLASSGIGTTIVKPCGLYGTGRNSTLVTSHNDKGMGHTVARADVASVMAEAVVRRSTELRFDLCSVSGPATSDLAGLLGSARWPWQKGAELTTAI